MTGNQITLTIHREGTYSSLWLKGIRAVRLDRHCIETFVGTRYPVDRLAVDQTVTLELPATEHALYLCGVSAPYRWAENAHLALVPASGAEWSGSAMVKGLEVTVAGAVPIFDWGENDVDPNHPMFGDGLYRTCRNLQFGWWAHGNLGVAVVSP